MHEVEKDEILCASAQVEKADRFAGKSGCMEYFIVNGCPFGDFVYGAFYTAQSGVRQLYVLESENDRVGSFSADCNETVYEDLIGADACFSNAKIYFFVDLRSPEYKDPCASERIIRKLDKWLKIAGNGTDCRFLLLPILKSPDHLPEGITSLAEREYGCCLLRNERDFSEELYLALEGKCREAVRRGGTEVVLLRFGNIFGPGIDLSDAFPFAESIRAAFSSSCVELDPEDSADIYSYTYVRDAAAAVAIGAGAARNGNVYHVSDFALSRWQIKTALQAAFPEKLSLSSKAGRPGMLSFHALNSLKLRKCGWTPSVDFLEAIYRTAVSVCGIPYDIGRGLEIYSGRLGRIKGIELGMLKFVDKVCRENDIRYFITGGSLLGAVRHHGIIPWDDDLDVGMLRPDFEKFRKICPKLMPDFYTYESHRENRDCHYCFDKIRLKGSYFSTDYSSHFQIPDGVFLDVLVYDQTSNLTFMAKLHIRLIRIWTVLISIKWIGRPRKNVHYRFSQLALPIMRRIPFSAFHFFFERLLRWYEKKKDAKYLIDSVGQNIGKGPFPKEWMADVTYIPFEDMKAPVPAGYDGFLKHLYGEHYMDIPPVSKRAGGHRIARIDLGGYLYGDGTSRRSDLRGELYEPL